MKQYTNSFFFILCLLFTLSIHANVSTMGADISYNCVGKDVNNNSQYEFIVNLYYICKPEDPPTPGVELQLLVESNMCGESFTFPLPLKNLGGIEVTPLCEAWTDSSTCHNNRFPGVVQFQYTNIESSAGFLTLPCEASDWTISLTNIARNETITNLQNPEDHSLYIEAVINNQGGRCNNSPAFGPKSVPYMIPATSPLSVPYYCIGLEAVFDQGIIEPDGNGLAFRLVQPMGAGGIPIPYVTGLSQGNPMANTDFDFGLGTGQIIFTADEPQNAVISIVIEERDLLTGLSIGSVMRELQFIVIDCSNQQVKVEEGTDKSIEVCPNEIARFDIVILDEDEEDLLQISTSMLNQLPGAMLINATGSSPLTATFEWTPTVADLGFHNILFYIQDDACPTYSQLTQTYQIRVTQNILLNTTNYTYCVTDPLNVLTIDLDGCGPFSFDPMPTEIIEEDGKITGIVPNLDFYTYTISNAEGDSEELEIEYIADFEVDFVSNDSVICEGETVVLDLLFSDESVDCEVVYFMQMESATSAVICGECPNVSPTETTLYTAMLTCGNGCEVRDDILIRVENEPTLTLMTNNPTLTPDGSLVTVTAMGNFDSVEWETGETSSSIEVLVEALATIEATAYSANGCSTTQSILLIYNCGDINLPSAFSPNGDSINDEFGIAIPVEDLVDFTIYNRWGKPVFRTSDATQKWDGMVDFEPQPNGIYPYYIEARCRDKVIVNQGFVALIR